MAVLQGADRICPPHVCVIQKTPCGIGLNSSAIGLIAVNNVSVVVTGVSLGRFHVCLDHH